MLQETSQAAPEVDGTADEAMAGQAQPSVAATHKRPAETGNVLDSEGQQLHLDKKIKVES